MRTLPLTPCDSCMSDADAQALTPVGLAIYCPHHQTLSIHDRHFDTWVTYTGLDTEQAADVTAQAVADRVLLQTEAANHAPV